MAELDGIDARDEVVAADELTQADLELVVGGAATTQKPIVPPIILE